MTVSQYSRSAIMANGPSLMQEYIEPPEFRGLLYFDGLDSLGRPVVIVNADAMGENKGARKNAFQYIVQVLEPIVTQVHY